MLSYLSEILLDSPPQAYALSAIQLRMGLRCT